MLVPVDLTRVPLNIEFQLLPGIVGSLHKGTRQGKELPSSSGASDLDNQEKVRLLFYNEDRENTFPPFCLTLMVNEQGWQPRPEKGMMSRGSDSSERRAWIMPLR